ncbi:XRE family transcriptional regulator [Allofrancisella inopinata]|uniref:XRE family transcriptional regulator n=1 Tax=Allofrancisella inopinata TaxID=1085647 RepID=A0AAE6YGW9_9GAMM|nr:helix-turn-helix transcriptional regulator [Allofrancisella inopinata]QIV95710.1 XRE family transcriptional regulator [Allofrancisella inopinata]
MAKDIAKRAQAKRLSLNLSQQTLSKVSGVSYGTLKKFERTGQISLESLLKIAIVLDEFEKFEQLFVKKAEELPASLDELLVEESTRKRGRK